MNVFCISLAYNGHCLTLARAFGGLATSCSWPPFFSLQALGNRQTATRT